MNDGEITGTMNSSNSARWEVPRAGVRLWLTFALGAAGVALFPGRLDFVPNPFASRFGVAGGLIWVFVALLSIVALRRFEGTKYTWRFSPWFFLRGGAVALSSPLLLFAARPMRSDSSGRLGSFSKFGFAAFPLLVAAGFTLVSFGDMLPRDFRWLSIRWFSFSVWAWLGCALLFLFSPWPDTIRIPSRAGRAKSERIGSTVTFAVLITVLFIIHSIGRMHFLLICGYIPGGNPLVYCAMLYLVLPWLAWPFLPKLNALPDERKTGPLGTAAFFVVALVPMIGAAMIDRNLPIRFVLSGEFLSIRFALMSLYGATDLPSVLYGRLILIASLLSLICLTYVAIARWASDRKSRAGYWCFAIPAALMCLYPLIFLALPFWWLIQYVATMGFTPKRIYGIAYCLIFSASMLSLLVWALWKPSRTMRSTVLT